MAIRRIIKQALGGDARPEQESPVGAVASVAALIVGTNCEATIGETVLAVRAIPGVDIVLVVDDGSTDRTQAVAREAGAVVVRHSHHRGRASAHETGIAVIGMRDDPGAPARHLLLVPGSLGAAAVAIAPIVPPVLEGVTDLAIALTHGGGDGVSSAHARNAIAKTSGWSPQQPLSRIRCVSREALEAALPLAHGKGMDVGMTLDVLTAGFRVTEVPCDLSVKVPQGPVKSRASRAGQYRDVMMALSARRVRKGLAVTHDAALGRLNRDEAIADDAEETP